VPLKCCGRDKVTNSKLFCVIEFEESKAATLLFELLPNDLTFAVRMQMIAQNVVGSD